MVRESYALTVKKQKDITHKHQIFQEGQKTDTQCKKQILIETCLLYTSDAADDLLCVKNKST